MRNKTKIPQRQKELLELQHKIEVKRVALCERIGDQNACNLVKDSQFMKLNYELDGLVVAYTQIWMAQYKGNEDVNCEGISI